MKRDITLELANDTLRFHRVGDTVDIYVNGVKITVLYVWELQKVIDVLGLQS